MTQVQACVKRWALVTCAVQGHPTRPPLMACPANSWTGCACQNMHAKMLVLRLVRGEGCMAAPAAAVVGPVRGRHTGTAPRGPMAGQLRVQHYYCNLTAIYII